MPRTSPTRKRGGSGTATSSSPSSSPKRAEITLVDSDQDQDEKESPPRDAEEEVVLVDAPCVKCGRSDEALPVSCGHALHSACYAKVSCFGGGGVVLLNKTHQRVPLHQHLWGSDPVDFSSIASHRTQSALNARQSSAGWTRPSSCLGRITSDLEVAGVHRPQSSLPFRRGWNLRKRTAMSAGALPLLHQFQPKYIFLNFFVPGVYCLND